MNYIYCILFSVFTITKAIICPSHYSDNLCLIIDESEEKEIENNDYCLECTYKYRKCKETDNFDNIYCNPVNGLCELNETEFNMIYDFDIDIDNKKENIVCTNFTYQKKGNNNELKYSLIVICIILFVFCIFMLWYIIYNKYYKNKQDKFIEERVLEEYKNSEANYETNTDSDCVMEIELDSDDRPKYTDDITESIIKL